MSMKYITHNDEPTLICSLERDQLKAVVVNQIRNAKPPKALAVHGVWGTGKTSFLQQVYTELGGDYFERKEGRGLEVKEKPTRSKTIKVKPVWFEAWQYQREPNILAALLKEIRNQLAWNHKIWQEAKETVVPGIMSLLQSIDFTFEQFGTKFGHKGFASKFVENEKAYQKEQLSTPLETLTLRKLLEDAIEKLLGIHYQIRLLNKDKKTTDPPKKVIVFIDDLDRCEPETAFEILEVIKLYLNLKNCVFVLGMDIKAVERILAKHYEKMMSPAKSDPNYSTRMRDLARLYLEKICQDVYHLPLPYPATREKLMAELIKDRIGSTKANDLEGKLLAVIKGYSFLPPFPRSIKIFANVLISFCSNKEIQKYTKRRDPNSRSLKKLLIFSYLYAFHYEIYQLCHLYIKKSFYNNTFLPFCEDPVSFAAQKGKHPLLNGLIVPEDITATEAFSGKTEEEIQEEQLARMFPHESLRQVLWIRNLIVESGPISDSDLKILQP